MIQFLVNKDKTLNSLLFLISEANRRERRLTQYDLVKTLFLADRAHLNKYGRPITFDRYVAMKDGPVASFAYDCLKPSFDWSVFNLGAAPWHAEKDGRKYWFSPSETKPNLRKISNSDQEHLVDALVSVMSLTFGQIRRLTHDDPAYVAAWRDNGGRSFPMDVELLLDDPSEDAIEDLTYLSEITAA